MSTEFNSNLNLGPVSTTKKVKPAEEIKEIAAAPGEEIKTPKSEGVPVGQSAIAGKSQIGKVDNVQNDIAAFCHNPRLIAISDDFFDRAYAKLCDENDPEAYEKACLMTSNFVNECVKKQI